MKKIITLLLLLAATLQVKAQTNADAAEKFVKAMAAQNYTEAMTCFDPTLPGLTKEVLEGGWKQITAMFGVYQSYTLPEGVDKNAVSITVPITFEKATQAFAISFNDQHKLLGFILAPAPAVKEETNTAATPARFKEEEISVAVPGGHLKGTMMYPDNAGPATPVALIIAGSGATDRNCNNGAELHTNAYLMLAEALAENGIASLRYDKRMIAKSNDFDPDERKLSFDDFVNDAVALCGYLKNVKNMPSVYIIGHSEGALIGTLAAQRTPVKAFVSLCGAGENIALTLKRQIPTPAAAEVLDKLRSGIPVNVPQELQVTFRSSVQPYLISWMKYEPAAELKKLEVPVLIVGGTTDLQVRVADANMLKQAVPKAQLRIIDGMNHVLKNAIADKTANLVTYAQPDLPLNTELTAAITGFLRGK